MGNAIDYKEVVSSATKLDEKYYVVSTLLYIENFNVISYNAAEAISKSTTQNFSIPDIHKDQKNKR